MKETKLSENSIIQSVTHLPDSKCLTGDSSLATLSIIHNHVKYNQSFDLSTTIKQVKQTMESLTGVPVNMQKLIYRNVLADDLRLEDLHFLTPCAKLMLIGSQNTEAEQLCNSETLSNYSNATESCASDNADDWCDQIEHKTILERFGKPENAMIGILNSDEFLAPDQCLIGLYDKRGHSLRLKIKSDTNELWLASKDVTNKFPLSIIQEVQSQAIKSHSEYHIMAFQLGPTIKSRYFVYWIPSQYVQSIKTMVMQHKLMTSMSTRL